MWQDERRKKTLRNVFLGLLCAVLIGGLVYGLIENFKEAEIEEARIKEELVKPPESLPSSQPSSRHMTEKDVEAEYKKDMDTVAQYLPGIVCWGDTFTSGSAGTVSFPAVLQRYIDTYICDIYDFRESINNSNSSNELFRLDWDNYKVKIPVINMGVDGEDTNTVLGRSGVVPFVLANDVMIPAGTEPVAIDIVSQNGSKVSPLRGGNGGINNVSIDGIEGILSLEMYDKVTDKKDGQYYFTRTAEGTAHNAAAQTPIVTAVSDMYKDYVHIVWMGAFNGYKSEKELVSQIKSLLARQTNNSDRYLVLGLCSKGGWGSFSSYDTAMTQAFGEHFINVRKYLCSDGLADAELTPTNQDIIATSNGIVPPSLRSSKGNIGLNGLAYKLVGKVVYDRMDQLGYFDEVVDELYIKEVTKELLKENPMFFSSIVENW